MDCALPILLSFDYLWARCLPVRACLCVYVRRQVRTQTGIVPLQHITYISGRHKVCPYLYLANVARYEIRIRFLVSLYIIR